MTTDAGQLLSMMQSFSAAEIAKRFNTGEGWFNPGGKAASGPQASAQSGQPRGSDLQQRPQTHVPPQATLAQGSVPQADRPAALSVAHLAAPRLVLTQTMATMQGTLPATGGLGTLTELAGPRAARPLVSGQQVSQASSTAQQAGAVPLGATQAMTVPGTAQTAMPAGEPTVLPGQSVASSNTPQNPTATLSPTALKGVPQALTPGLQQASTPGVTGQPLPTPTTGTSAQTIGQPVSQASVSTTTGAPNTAGTMSIAAEGRAGAAQPGQGLPLATPAQVAQPSPTVQQAAFVGASPVSEGAPPLDHSRQHVAARAESAPPSNSASPAGQPQATATQPVMQSSAITTPIQNIANHGMTVPVLTEALAIALDTAVSGRTQTAQMASGVIFNAAMIPGWPFPSALVRDSGVAINDKAVLHKLAEQVGKMSPEEAAEYLARIGGGYALLRKLRKLIKEIEGIDQQDVEGLLSSFLNVISSIADSIQVLMEQLNDSLELQEAVSHGDSEGRANRHRLKL